MLETSKNDWSLLNEYYKDEKPACRVQKKCRRE